VEQDGELVAKALAGSETAVTALFDRHWTTAWRAAYAVTNQRELADDAAQEAFVRAVRVLDRFDRSRPFAPWLAAIAVNRARDLLRSQSRQRSALAALAARTEGTAENHAQPLLDGLAALAPAHREVLVLHHILGFRLSEVAEILGLPTGTVASRLSRAVAHLRQTMEADQNV
jgi:RNA polymerase sigma-70 factor (ECF subfamily)